MATEALGWWGVPLAIAAGTMRGGTPFLFVSLGECLTEKSGKINLGLEGTLLTGAMTAYAAFLSDWFALGRINRCRDSRDGFGLHPCLAHSATKSQRCCRWYCHDYLW
jgi:hypothetical protein